MRKQTKEQLNQILGALIIPDSTKDKLVNLVEGLEAEVEAGLHNIHYLEKKVDNLQSDYEDISSELEAAEDKLDDLRDAA